MKKSSSHVLFKLDFNPKEFAIGQSKIQQLPMRSDSRRYSTSHLQKLKTNVEHTQIETLRKLNQVYARENETLRKQIQNYKKCLQDTYQSKAVSKQLFECKGTYKELIKEKISNKTSRVTTECETGLFSSKEVSESQLSITITEYLSSLKDNNHTPSLTQVEDVTSKFFRDYCENYSKIKSLFECLREGQGSQRYKKISDLMQIYKLPLVYQKSPKSLIRSVSKEKSRIKKKEQQICLQSISPNETIVKLEGILLKMMKSPQMMRLLRSNEVIRRLFIKINDKH